MLKISVPVTTWIEEEVLLEDFKALVVESRYYDAQTPGFSYLKEPEVTLYKPAPPHCIRGFAEVPCSIFPWKPEDVCWSDHVISNLEVAYNYLSEKGLTL